MQKRTAWITRQMGYGARAAPIEEPDPLPETEADVATPAAPVETPEQQLQQQLEQEEAQRILDGAEPVLR